MNSSQHTSASATPTTPTADHSISHGHDAHHHAHHSGHGHHHAHSNLFGTKLLITIVLNIVITVAQVIGGLISGSLALMSDALHNFSDVVALVVVYIANRMAKRAPTQNKTFGYKRAEVLSALFNSAILVGIGVFLIFEAVHKFFHPQEVLGLWVIALAILSIVLNWVSVMLIAKEAKNNTNVKAAYLHLLTDAMTSVGVLISGVLIWAYQLYWVDSLMTIIIAVYLIYASWSLLRQTTGVLMLFTPKSVQVEKLVKIVAEFEAIENIHHIHIWQLDDYEVHLEAHLDFKNDLLLSEVTKIVQALEVRLQHECHINHFNFQTEFGRDDCKDLINSVV